MICSGVNMVDWSSSYGGWKWAGIQTKLPYCYKFVLWWRHIKIYNQICIKVSFPSRRGWWMNEMFNLSSHRQNNFNRTHIVSTPIGQTWTARLDQDQLANIFSNRESKYCRCRPLERLRKIYRFVRCDKRYDCCDEITHKMWRIQLSSSSPPASCLERTSR